MSDFDYSEEHDLSITSKETYFERKHYTPVGREHPEYEIEVDFNAEGDSVTDLVENAEARAAELAQGRDHYVWRILADEVDGVLKAGCTMYVYVPRTQTMAERAKVEPDGEG